MDDARATLFDMLEDTNRREFNKGVKIYNACKDRINLLSEEDDPDFEVLVPSESGNGAYEVLIEVEEEDVSCSCPAFDQYFSCKHIPAALLYVLIDHLDESVEGIQDRFNIKLGDRKEKPKTAPKETKPPDPIAAGQDWKTIVAHPQNLRAQVSYLSHSRYTDWQLRRSVKVIASDEQALHWKFSVTDNRRELFPEIMFDRHETYRYRCTCRQQSIVCTHVSVVFEAILDKTPDFFVKHKDFTLEKKKMLEPYGIKPDDPEARFFEFSVSHAGVLTLKPPPFIWKKGAAEKFSQLKGVLAPKKGARPSPGKEVFINFDTGFLLNLVSKHFRNGFELEPIKIITKAVKPTFQRLSLHDPANYPLLRGLPDDIYDALIALGNEGLKRWLMPTSYQYYYRDLAQLDEKESGMLQERYFEQLQKLWSWLAQQPVYVLREGKFVTANLYPATVSPLPVKPGFSVAREGQFISIQLLIQKEDTFYPPEAFTFHNGFLIEVDGAFHLPTKEDRTVLQEFSQGFIRIHESDKTLLIRDIIPHLQKKYSVVVPDDFRVDRLEIAPRPQVLLREYEDKYLMLQPQFDYDGMVADYEPGAEDIFRIGTDGTLQTIARNEAAEGAFFESLRPLHSAFERQAGNPFFYLPFNEVMKGAWFLKMVAELQGMDIPVLGIKDLKKFKYNTASPKWEMKAGSGIDWFDLQIDISFGDQKVSLPEVRKAVMSGQNVVVLGDGTFGLLPEEWLQQYGMLLKMGDAQKDGTLRISKLHYTLIDELHSGIDDEQVLREIEEKKMRLRNIDNITAASPSKEINASLRPYQLSGFQWMQVLDEVGWGGCLADDMGLGKTLQAITFLQYLKEKYTGSTHLVVCPTSLIYNWETELKKFAPALKYHIHYGKERDFSEEHFEQYDLVITSYGILRLDIEHLMRFSWHYVILDESQAIKNPEAQITKALQLVKSRNRLILSGTPVQNNTYDLYAQFNFINPGLLGNRDFFRTEFANPIDKNNDAEKSSRLRRLVYPFLLRRTKEQVATDLPDKTETILWCDMPKDQRAVYNHYKDYYRKLLMEKIAEVGMAKAGMYVLEGLLRLRQICDSPQLLKAKDVKTTTSIKAQMLTAELKENTGQHKVLVFSQFTEMLAIIRQSLEEEKMPYCYLDGATPAEKRQEAVELFQQDEGYKVFLISLKAGGVGLNLTAADYVYLVDPWWNPAVEQQAIDRTHRIGQTQKIFAYKMICKDTVEEKILQLQGRKKQLANDLITEDTGFIKKLGKEDIAFLFS